MSSEVIVVEGVVLRFPRQRNIISIIADFIRKRKRNFTALNGINLSINKGEIIGIIGTNGCGKSTLLRIISGIYIPDKGVCKVAGNISLLAGLGAGFSSHQTGRENAILYGSVLGYGEEKIKEKLPEIISFSELDEFIDEPIRTYSAGMKARLGLAVASAIQPDILLIDEVLGVGDPTFKKKSTDRIIEMVEDAGTVVIVSHSFGMLSNICNRLILIDNGKIVAEGEPSSVIREYHDRAAARKGDNK